MGKEETDFFDREIFVEEIFDKIKNEHSNSNSSFIFGISGYWGEGKTFLLKKLENKLVKDSFNVIWFSPWKYAGDKASLMRIFIKKINLVLDKSDRENLDDFENDTTRVKFKLKILIPLILIILFALFIYYSSSSFHLFVDSHKAFGLLLIPAFLTALPAMTNIQKSTKAITAVDQFDERLKVILQKLNDEEKKLIVFVDDLDRISAKEAKQVLDSLRTFFDKPELSYVVTGDHKVLEAIISLNDDDVSDGAGRREEGRRFLKKIFNVYWRIPLPTKSQLKKFIKVKLEGASLTETQKEVITEWLTKYFELNARNIERFIEMIKFNINSLERRKKLFEGAETEKDNFEQINEVLDNKELLVRALMIQEKAYPLYEKIVKKNSLIVDIEKRIDVNQDFSDLLGQVGLTEEQTGFLADFLSEEPRFYMNGGSKVRIYPFFMLSSEVGLGDDRGISMESFERYIKSSEIEKIVPWLNLMENKSELALKAGEIVNLEGDPDLKRQYLLNILKSLASLKTKPDIFINEIVASLSEVSRNIAIDLRSELLNAFYPVFDKVEDSSVVLASFPFISAEEFLLFDGELGRNSSQLIGKWFNTYSEQSYQDALARLVAAKEKLDLKAIKEIISEKRDFYFSNFQNLNDKEMDDAFNYFSLIGAIKEFKAYFKDKIASFDNSIQDKITNSIIRNFGKKTWRKKRVIKWFKE